MTKQLLIGLIAGVIIITGGVAAFLVSDSSDSNETQNVITNDSSTDEQSDNSASQAATTASIKQLIGEGGARECSFAYDDADGNATGTAYFDGNSRMRMNFTSATAEGSYSGSMIVTTESQTVWDNGSKQGFSFTQSINETTPATDNSFDTNKDINFECKNWNLDNSFFSVPNDVTVTDFSQFNVPTN